MQGIGEKFSPDLHTGTGNFTVPIALPPGRNGFQPQLNLVYSTGNGNGPFGLGWSLSIPGVSRKTSKGVPRYNDYHPDLKQRDIFILPAPKTWCRSMKPTGVKHIPARAPKACSPGFCTAMMLETTTTGRCAAKTAWSASTAHRKHGKDPAAIADPTRKGEANRVFAWKLTETEDPFGNRIDYDTSQR